MLASPGRSSGRVLPPSLFPVVPAQRARLGLRRPPTRPVVEVETAVRQIFEVPPAPLHVLGTDPPDVRVILDPAGDGWDGRPRSIGPIGGSGNGLPAAPPPTPEPPPAAARPGPPARRRPWWRRI